MDMTALQALFREMAAKYEATAAELDAARDRVSMDADEEEAIAREVETLEGDLRTQLERLDQFRTWASSENLLRRSFEREERHS